MSKLLYALALLTLYITWSASIAGLFSQHHLLFDLTSHFKLQYAIAALVTLPVLFITRAYFHVVMCVALLVFNTAHIVPWYFSDNAPSQFTANESAADKSANATNNDIKLFVNNVLSSNTSTDALLQQIKDERPDIIVLLETNRLWIDRLSDIEQDYPYRAVVPREDYRGMALYSKLPILSDSIEFLSAGATPSIMATLLLDNASQTEFILIATHPLAPVSGSYYASRNAQLSAIAAKAEKLNDNPLIVAGDLNTTLWSKHYKILEEQGSLANARTGFGVAPTWPSLFSVFGIPIDHVLISEHFAVEDFRIGSNTGSDHLPIIAKLRLRELK